MADRRVILPIKGMECGACAAMIERRLASAEGVRAAHVNFTTGLATVSITDGGLQAADLLKAVRELGFDGAGTTVRFDVSNFRHTSAVERLERELKKLRGVLSASAILEYPTFPHAAQGRRTMPGRAQSVRPG